MLLLLGGNCRGSWTVCQLPCTIRYPIRLVHPLPLIRQIGGGGHLCVQRNGAIVPHDVMILETMMFCLTLFRYSKRLAKGASGKTHRSLLSLLISISRPYLTIRVTSSVKTFSMWGSEKNRTKLGNKQNKKTNHTRYVGINPAELNSLGVDKSTHRGGQV